MLLELVVVLILGAKAIQIDAVDACLGNAGGRIAVQGNRGPVQSNVVALQNAGRRVMISDIDAHEIDA